MGKAERKVEDYLIAGVAELGGECEKHTSPGRKGVPDQIVKWPVNLLSWDASVEWVETKADGVDEDTPHSRRQKRDHEKRRAMGFRVYVLNSIAAVDVYLDKRRRQIMEYAES
jgi:hypothetical protein